MQHYVIKFVSDLRQVSGFPGYSNKTDRHDITEILLKVSLNAINQTFIVFHNQEYMYHEEKQKEVDTFINS